MDSKGNKELYLHSPIKIRELHFYIFMLTKKGLREIKDGKWRDGKS